MNKLSRQSCKLDRKVFKCKCVLVSRWYKCQVQNVYNKSMIYFKAMITVVSGLKSGIKSKSFDDDTCDDDTCDDDA